VLINALANDVAAKGSKLSIASVSTPTNGTAQIVPATAKTAAMIRYSTTTPSIADTFTYQVVDTSGATGVGQVVVYGLGLGQYHGTITSTAGAQALGSVALSVGNLGAVSGTVVLGKHTVRIAGVRIDSNGRLSMALPLSKGVVAILQMALSTSPQNELTGTIVDGATSGQFVAQ
jgi:hypothetical protein